MRYSKLSATRRRRIRVPRLDGGLNLDDLPSGVADNQITACRNMWWHEGALRTRPGMIADGGASGDYNIVQPLDEGETLLMHYQPNGTGDRLFYAVLRRADGSYERFGLSSTYCLQLPDLAGTPLTAFGCHAPDGLDYDFIFFFGGGDIVTYAYDTQYLTYASPYVPHISADGAPTALPRAGSPAGEERESPNLLSDQGVCTYTTDGVGTYFYLPAAYRGATLTMRLTLDDPAYGEAVTVNPIAGFTFSPTAFGLDRAYYGDVTLGYQYNAAQGYFRLYGNAARTDGTSEIVPLPPDRRNNLRVTLTGYRDYAPDRICRMHMTTWFGGKHSGIGGGTRLFLAGDSRHPQRLHWSGVNDPLYFPASNYTDVGDSHAAITALHKQSDMLIIFKTYEIFAATYVSDSDPVTTTVDSDEEIPTAWRAHFPITPLHSTVGCDCPDSIQLVNNKLVWLTAAGQLYMLSGVNRDSERNVRAITALIAPALAAHTDAERRAASGGEYDGRYMLTVGRAMYVLDCRNTAFNGYGQYVNENTALRALIYYRWELPPYDSYRLVSGGDTLTVMSVDRSAQFVGFHRLEGETDNGNPIPASFTTKHFAAEDPADRMSITAVYLDLSDTQGAVRVTYHSDRGDTADAATLAGRLTTPDSHHVTPRRLTPAIHRVCRFGLTCACDTAFAVSGIGITARIDGAVR